MIAYEEIDCEIRPLVALLNRFQGVATRFSCAGHGEGEDAYVTFTAENGVGLHTLVQALPLPWRATVVGNQMHWQTVQVTVGCGSDGDLVYDLRIAGAPERVRWEAVGDVEQRFRLALGDPPQPTRLSCSIRESGGSEDKCR